MDYAQVESSQRQHHEVFEHQSKMNMLVEQEEYNLFALLKPKIYIDGDSWCVRLGDDIQNGIVGFGKSPYLAILDFNKAFHATVNPY